MFANVRNTCSIIIYRIICLFIILFFQKENVDSGRLRFCAIYGLYWILHLDLGRSVVCYNRRRGIWKMSFVMRSWHFYDCEQVLKTSWASYHHYPSRVVRRPLTWSTSCLPSREENKLQGPPVWSSSLPVKKKKKTLIVFTVHVSQDIFKIYYTWILLLVFNHLSSLSCNLNWSDYWVNIAVTQGVHKWNVSLCHKQYYKPFHSTWLTVCMMIQTSHPCLSSRFSPPDIYRALSIFP